jgi:hypothetical protein
VVVAEDPSAAGQGVFGQFPPHLHLTQPGWFGDFGMVVRLGTITCLITGALLLTVPSANRYFRPGPKTNPGTPPPL